MKGQERAVASLENKRNLKIESREEI